MNKSQYLSQWKHPSDYGGFSPEGDYMICGQSRDSDALERSNYQRIFEDLIKKAESLGCQDSGIDGEGDESNMVYDFRAGHWAVGWVEQVLICSNAPQELIDFADEISAALWPTVTTRERLTGLLSSYDAGYVAQRGGRQVIGDIHLGELGEREISDHEFIEIPVGA